MAVAVVDFGRGDQACPEAVRQGRMRPLRQSHHPDGPRLADQQDGAHHQVGEERDQGVHDAAVGSDDQAERDGIHQEGPERACGPARAGRWRRR